MQRQITITVKQQSETSTRLPELKVRIPVLTPKFPFPPIIPEVQVLDVRGFAQDEPAVADDEQDALDVEGYAYWILGGAALVGVALGVGAVAGFDAAYHAGYDAGAQKHIGKAQTGIGYHAGYAAGKAAGKAGD